MRYEVALGGATRTVEVRREGQRWRIEVDGEALPADVALIGDHTISLLIEGRSFTFSWSGVESGPAGWTARLISRGREIAAEVRDPRRLGAQSRFEQAGRARLCAPMAGKVVRLLAAAGDSVESGQGLVVLEAMKMQNEVRSPKNGVLVNLAVAPGVTVASGQLLAEVE